MLNKLAEQFSLSIAVTEQITALLDDGNTIPFIARYRKEATGGIDDQVLREFSDRLEELRAIEARKADILRLIEEQEKLTPEIEKAVEAAQTLTALEDIYRPYRPKRKTRASVARARGLEKLADALMTTGISDHALQQLVNDFISPEKEVPDADAAFAGAMDIIAEDLSDTAPLREKLRNILFRTGIFSTRKKKDEPSVYEMYYEYTENMRTMPGHRILAINRGEKEGFLAASLEMEDELAINHTRMVLPQSGGQAGIYLDLAAKDAWKRLLFPSLSTEVRNQLTQKAEDEAMLVFSKNLRDLLMVPPMRGHVVLALDPAYRTGCKIAVLEETGKPCYTGVIYPTPPQNKTAESAATVLDLCKRFSVSMIAIGNGTASRESERFIADTIKEAKLPIRYYMVNESGASVYSASPLAAAEFPDLDLTRRSAVSIGRRVQDPLAELVKIDPQSIGVGQYQHDMNEKKLEHVLGGVVEDCVNDVGVNLNTASPSLLSYVAGISKTVAENIVRYREENGAFTNRTQLKKIPRLGGKAFEQCAGFLRIPDGKEPLDNTRVHPESYDIARKMQAEKKPYALENLSQTWAVGLPTLIDIVSALENPGYDPREELAQPELRTDVMEMTDLREGMELVGVVRNVSAFGAFVDIGVHQDGLVHISQMADHFVKNAMDEVRIGQQVRVRVIGLEIEKKRISLSMKGF